MLRRFMAAMEQADIGALSAMLREDARQTMPPALLWFDGRRTIIAHYTTFSRMGVSRRRCGWPISGP